MTSTWIMPHSPNCERQVEKEHHYCGRCGYPLANLKDEDVEIPPSGTAAANQGFLGGRSVEYIHKVALEGEELDTDSVGYANISSDVVAGLANYALVTFFKLEPVTNIGGGDGGQIDLV